MANDKKLLVSAHALAKELGLRDESIKKYEAAEIIRPVKQPPDLKQKRYDRVECIRRITGRKP